MQVIISICYITIVPILEGHAVQIKTMRSGAKLMELKDRLSATFQLYDIGLVAYVLCASFSPSNKWG